MPKAQRRPYQSLLTKKIKRPRRSLSPTNTRRTYRDTSAKNYKRPYGRSSTRYRKNYRRAHVPTTPIWTIIVLFCMCLVAIIISTLLTKQMPQKKQITIPHDTAYSLIGAPTISVKTINKELQYYHSPAQGKGQVLYDDGVKYNIDPAYALAFFMEESNMGTKGVATVTHSLGNIRAQAGEPSYDGYRQYSTWEEGFKNWYQLIDQTYIQKWNLTTIDQIIPVYAPTDDNNNEQQYINTVKNFVDQWRMDQATSNQQS